METKNNTAIQKIEDKNRSLEYKIAGIVTVAGVALGSYVLKHYGMGGIEGQFASEGANFVYGFFGSVGGLGIIAGSIGLGGFMVNASLEAEKEDEKEFAKKAQEEKVNLYNQQKLAEQKTLEEAISAKKALPKYIYQFETQPMTVQEAKARGDNINCILQSYDANVASKNFAAYPTRKTQVEMKNLLDKKNLLVDPEEFIAGVISIDHEGYASQVQKTIEAITPMKQSALTYEGNKIEAKATTETVAKTE
jgi:hypothetical protein